MILPEIKKAGAARVTRLLVRKKTPTPSQNASGDDLLRCSRGNRLRPRGAPAMRGKLSSVRRSLLCCRLPWSALLDCRRSSTPAAAAPGCAWPRTDSQARRRVALCPWQHRARVDRLRLAAPTPSGLTVATVNAGPPVADRRCFEWARGNTLVSSGAPCGFGDRATGRDHSQPSRNANPPPFPWARSRPSRYRRTRATAASAAAATLRPQRSERALHLVLRASTHTAALRERQPVAGAERETSCRQQ